MATHPSLLPASPQLPVLLIFASETLAQRAEVDQLMEPDKGRMFTVPVGHD